MGWRLAGHEFSNSGSGGGGSGSVLASFVYTALGTESTAGFTAVFPSVGTTSFVAAATPITMTAQTTLGTDPAANTAASAKILPGADLTAGDKILITVVGV